MANLLPLLAVLIVLFVLLSLAYLLVNRKPSKPTAGMTRKQAMAYRKAQADACIGYDINVRTHSCSFDSHSKHDAVGRQSGIYRATKRIS